MENTILLVKNISPTNLNIFTPYNATSIKPFGRRRALLSFPNPQSANFVLHQFHQTLIEGKIISIEYYNKSNRNSNQYEPDDKSEPMPSISNYVKKLYATNNELHFNQPPPPYLKYSYPKINNDILDSISIALMSNSRFYTQVLHLMNRMNLDPPFGPKCSNLESVETQLLSFGRHDVAIQTEPVSFLSDEESELESDSNEKKMKNRKRKLPTDKQQLYKSKAKKILQVTALIKNQSIQSNSQKETELSSVFELNKPLVGQKIALNVDKVKIPEPFNEDKEIPPIKEMVKPFVPPQDLKTNQIPLNQLDDLPVFKNYDKGQPSNKLYIKNLHKDVTEDDLQSIYERFFSSTLSIKVLQKGRMKGQAFVTFDNLEANQLGIVEEALKATNGFILRNKPMVVCYAKQ